MAKKSQTTERGRVDQRGSKNRQRRRYWPWSLCPCGSGVSFRRCCGWTGTKECRYEGQ